MKGNATLPEAEWLSEKVVPKFQVADPTANLQGVWIAAHTTHDWQARRDLFCDELPADRVHFAIVSFGAGRSLILAGSSEIAEEVTRLFHLTPIGEELSA